MTYDPRRIRGYHPPYCTCYDCNEAGRQHGRKRRRSTAALQDAMVSSFPWSRRILVVALRLFRILRSVTATALFCTVLIHVAVFVGILIYVGVQTGAPGGVLPMVVDTFTSAQEAYVQAWREVAG